MLRERVAPRSQLSRKDILYRAYVTVLVGPLVLLIATVPISHAVVAVAGEHPPLGAAAVPPALAVVAVVAAAALLALVRAAPWHGPVVLPAASLAWLLTSPQPRAALLRPRLVRTLRRSALAGAAVGAVAGLLIAEIVGTLVLLQGAVGAAAGAALALVGQAAAWWIVGAHARSRLALRWTAVGAGALAVIGAAALVQPAVAWVAAWSGPWGWAALLVVLPAEAALPVGAVLPVEAAVPREGLLPAGLAFAPALAGVLLAGAALLATRWTLRHVDVPYEELARRSAAAGGVTAALWLGDHESAGRLAREAADALRRPSRLRLPPPRGARLALPWRDATVAVRRSAALGRSLLAGALAGAAAALAWGALRDLTRAHVAGLSTEGGPPGGVPLLLVACVALAVAARGLFEPLRSGLAWPFGSLMLPWSDHRLVGRHLVFPMAALALAGMVGTCVIGAAWAIGLDPWLLLRWMPGGEAAGQGAPPVLLGAVLWVLAAAPGLVMLGAVRELRPPPDPAETAAGWMTEIAVMQQATKRAGAALPTLVVITAPMVLLTATVLATVTAPAAATALALAAVAVGWGATATGLAWWWLRRRPMPWQ